MKKHKKDPTKLKKVRPSWKLSRIEKALKGRYFLPAVLLLAALLRVAHVLAFRATPWFENLTLDCWAYDEWAQRIAAGDWIGSQIFYQDPLYPYFLAILYRLFGRDLLLVRLIQVGFGVGTCCLTALLGRRIFGIAVGNIAGLLASLFAPLIFYEAQIEKTFLGVFLVAVFLVLALRRSMSTRFFAGTALGLASLTRGNLLIFVPLAFLVLLFERSPASETTDRPTGAIWTGLVEWRSFRYAAAFLGGSILILSPVALRNYHVHGEWVLTTSQAGQNFYTGNNPQNTTGCYNSPSFVRANPRYEQADFRNKAEVQTGRSLKPSEVSEFWFGEAWKQILKNPDFAVKIFVRKFALFWNNYEIPDNNNIYLLARYSLVLRFLFISLGWIVPLAVMGAVVSFRDRWEIRILAGFMIIYCLSVVAFFIVYRYRVQIVTALIVLAVYGGSWLVAQVRQAKWRNAACGGLLVLIVGLFCFQNPTWQDRTEHLAISLRNLGSLHITLGNTQQGIKAYREAVKTSPKNTVSIMQALGKYYMQVGNFKEAEKYMMQAANAKPRNIQGWSSLVQLYKKMLNLHMNEPRIFYNLAIAYFNAGQITESRKALEKAESLDMPLPAMFIEKLERAEAESRGP